MRPSAARAALLLGLAAPLAGCEWGAGLLAGEPPAWGGTTASSRPGIDGRLEWEGQQSEIQARATLVARTQEEWAELWRRTAQEPPGPLPRGWMAVAVFGGVQNSGGYRVQVLDVVRARRSDVTQIERMLATYRISTPPPGGATSQAQTSPWAIRLVQDTPLRVEFERVL